MVQWIRNIYWMDGNATLDQEVVAKNLQFILDMTDAGVWNDDNGRVAAETSFRLGGVSGKKGHYLIELEVREDTEK